MSDQDTHPPRYVLGSEAAEVARLEQQAQSIAQPTMALLQAAGIRPGMRVLDLGTGLGHVSLLLAGLVGPTGEVVGIDQDARMLEHAEERRAAAGAGNVRYVEADVRGFRDDEPFDAVVERLVLFHLPDAVDVVRHYAEALRPGGVFVAIDFDVGAARGEPSTPLLVDAVRWILAAFRAARADPTIGTRLAPLLREAGLEDVAGFGIQGYVPPDDPRGPTMVAGVVRSLAPQLIASGIASEGELGLDTLEARIRAEVAEHQSTLLMPTVAGAFGRRGAA